MLWLCCRKAESSGEEKKVMRTFHESAKASKTVKSMIIDKSQKDVKPANGTTKTMNKNSPKPGKEKMLWYVIRFYVEF